MFCINCGCELEHDAVFCNQCGTRVETAQTVKEAEKGKEQEQKTNEIVVVEDVVKQVEVSNNQQDVKNKGKKKKGLFVLVALFTLFVVVLGGLVGFGLYYLKGAEVEYTFKEVTTQDYFSEKGQSAYTYKSEGEFELILTSDVVNTMVKSSLTDVTISKPMEFKNVYLDLDEETIFIEISYMGLTLPLKSEVEIDTKGNKIIIEANDYNMGDKELGIPELIKSKLPKEYSEINIELDNISESFKISNAKPSSDNLEIELAMDLIYIQDIINGYINQYDPQIVDNYYKFSNTTYGTDLAYDIIYYYEYIETYEVEEYLANFMEEGVLTKEFLGFLQDNTINEIYEKYGSVLSNKVAKEEVFALKEEFLLEQKIAYARDMLYYLDDYEWDFYEDVFVYNGLLYDRVAQQYITPELICDWYTIDTTDAANMEFLVDIDGLRYVIYNSNSGKVYKIDSYDVEVLDEKINTDYSYPTPKTIETSDITTISQKIVDYYFYEGDKVYYRYLNIVDDSAYAIISTSEYPEVVYGFALMNKGNTWEVIDVDGNFSSINSYYPEFNVFTFPTYDQYDLYLYGLTYESFDVLLNELVLNGYYSSTSDIYVDFYSYDYDYVYVLLNDGKEYVYSIFYGEISEVYDRDTAEGLWMLQPGFTLQKLQ